MAQKSIGNDHLLTSGMEVRSCGLEEAVVPSDHRLVGATGQSRRPRLVAIRPLRDGEGGLGAMIAAQSRVGIAHGNKCTIATHMGTLAHAMVRCAARLPRPMHPKCGCGESIARAQGLFASLEIGQDVCRKCAHRDQGDDIGRVGR